MTDAARYLIWVGMVAIGAALAIADRRLGWPVLGLLLIVVGIGGAIATRVSPFTFQGGDHYMQGVIAMGAAGLGLIGYLGAAGAHYVCKLMAGGRSQ